MRPSCLGGSLRSLQLAPRLGAPHPLRDEQAGRVDRDDRHLVVVRQPLQRRHVLADRVGRHHHLDAVVPKPGGDLERRRRRLRVDRGRRQRDRAVGTWARGRTCHCPIQSSRRRITPSRSAHGQISSDSASTAVHHRTRPRSHRPAAGVRVPVEIPGSSARWRADILASSGTQSDSASRSQQTLDVRAGRARGRPGQPGQLFEGLRRADDVLSIRDGRRARPAGRRSARARACAAA